MKDLIEFKKILSEKNIELFDEYKFKSKLEEINFLNKLTKIIEFGVSIKYLNSHLIKIIEEIELDEKIVKKLKEINWDDFSQIISNPNKNQREIKIYENFINFLRIELNILRDEMPLIDKTLIDTKNISNEKVENKINSKLFKKYEDFNIAEDLKHKINKYNVDVLFDYVEPSGKITVNDFTLYFNRRLQYFTNLLKNRVNMDNVVKISNLEDLWDSSEEVSLIGLVNDISQTKNGHYMITIEDRSSQVKCFVNKDKSELVSQVERLCLDEGVGIVGKVGKEIIWIDEIVMPSAPNPLGLKKTDEENYVAFLSDIHFGAKVFVDVAFSKMIDFFNSKTNNEKLNEIAKKIKHIIIAGDMIEGIGIYPGQGKDARILSTEGQYCEAARWLDLIPKDKSIIIVPGNHDTSRLSEPQLKLSYDKAYALYNMENTIMLSNPATVDLFSDDLQGPMNFYIYHGGSLFYYADKIQELRDKGGAKTPEEVVKFLLEKRHLAPSHGSTLYIPDSQTDPLVIKKIPDFFVTGHTHKLSLANFKGCTIVSCGCWVEMSDYQEKMGMFPDIGKLTIVNTKTRKPQILNFYTELHNRDKEEKK